MQDLYQQHKSITKRAVTKTGLPMTVLGMWKTNINTTMSISINTFVKYIDWLIDLIFVVSFSIHWMEAKTPAFSEAFTICYHFAHTKIANVIFLGSWGYMYIFTISGIPKKSPLLTTTNQRGSLIFLLGVFLHLLYEQEHWCALVLYVLINNYTFKNTISS